MAAASLTFVSSIPHHHHHHHHHHRLLFSSQFPSITFHSLRKNPTKPSVPLTFAVADSNPNDPVVASNDDEDDLLPLLQQLSEALILPPDFISRLPKDLRLDVNDAAFDISNGPVMDECGEEVGDLLLNLARAWEKADTSTSNSLARKLPSLESCFTSSRKSAFGKRLMAAGRRFQAMGQYGDGEVQRIAKTMLETGKLLTRTPVVKADEKPTIQTRMFKFGELQVALTPQKAYIGSAIGLVFGILSWQISQGIQSIPEDSLVYANDNALLLAKSLRGALLVLFYSTTFLSAFSSLGLVLLGRQLSSESKPNDP